MSWPKFILFKKNTFNTFKGKKQYFSSKNYLEVKELFTLLCSPVKQKKIKPQGMEFRQDFTSNLQNRHP